jgi:hypothetical protein
VYTAEAAERGPGRGLMPNSATASAPAVFEPERQRIRPEPAILAYLPDTSPGRKTSLAPPVSGRPSLPGTGNWLRYRELDLLSAGFCV